MAKIEKTRHLLVNIGLTKKEADVYQAALGLGPTTVLALARASGVNRTTVYPLIRSLQRKGLMHEEPRGFKRLFAAESPEKLDAMVEERRRELAESLPELLGTYNLRGGEDGTVQVYEGLNGVKQVYESLIHDTSSGSEYLVMSHEERWLELDPKYFSRFLERRARQDFKVRTLLTASPLAEERKTFAKNFRQEVKILPKNFDLKTNIVITPQRVVFHQLTLPITATVLRNKTTIDALRQCFEMIWAATK